MEELVNFNHLRAVDVVTLKKNYLEFCSSPVTISKCTTFNWRDDKSRLDEFIFSIIDVGNFNFPNDLFITFVKKILLLFSGNSYVERGYNINDECLLENMMDIFLIVQRSTYSGLSKINLKTFEINKSLVQYAKNASGKRQEHLKKKNAQKEDENNKRKQLASELFELENKRRAIEEIRNE